MSTRKRRDPRSLEPEAPDMYEAPSKRTAAEERERQRRLDQIIDRGLELLIATVLRGPTHPPMPGPLPIAQSFPSTPIYRDVRATPIPDLVLARCEAAPPVRTPLCGERYVPRRWVSCPYCGHLLQAPVQ